MDRPNIVYIHSHDTGRYIQPYGHAVPTPNYQRFAEQGVLFRQAFCCGPTCSPSRAGLLTGQMPHNNGMIGLAHLGMRLNDYSKHIIHTLRKAGYYSALIGQQHVAPETDMIGYDHADPTDCDARDLTPRAVKWLEQSPAEPFFLSVGFHATHREFPKASQAEDARYTMPPAPFADTPRTRADMAEFKASARELDDGFGAVMDAVDRTGLADRTLVIATTDHGLAFPYMKCNLTDHGIGVMLMMRGPGGFEGGKVVDGMVSHLDIFPTICDLLGIDRPEWLQGQSVLPLVSGQAKEVNEEIYSEVTYHCCYDPSRCVRTKRYKYIRRFDDRITPILPDTDDGLTKDVWMEAGWREKRVDPEQLYDLVFDPNETNNLIDDPAYAGTAADMRRRLDDWMTRTDDPLLKGPIAAPTGAWLVDPDQVSPRSDGFYAP
ncbi:MAG: sulfatase family protein [Planctomycetota bacterium]